MYMPIKYKILKFLNYYLISFLSGYGTASLLIALFFERLFYRDFILSFIPTIALLSIFSSLLILLSESHKARKNNKIKIN